MTHAYMILAHQDPVALIQLLDSLPAKSAFVHLDRPFRKRLSTSQMGEIESRAAQVVESLCLHWGGYSIHLAMMSLMRAARAHDSNASFFTFLWGACFPLRPIADFEAFVNAAPYSVHCRAMRLSDGKGQMASERVTRDHHLDGVAGHARKSFPVTGGALRKLLWTVDRRRLVAPTDMTMHVGLQWTTLPRGLVDDLLEAHDLGRFEFFRRSFAPDEMIIPSYVHSSAWAAQTRFGRADIVDSMTGTIANHANNHWLRPSLKGTVSLGDVSRALDSGMYFTRKIPSGPDGDRVRAAIVRSWGK